MTHSFLPNFSRLVSGGAEEAGMKGWRERAADVFTEKDSVVAKTKFAPGLHMFSNNVPMKGD